MNDDITPGAGKTKINAKRAEVVLLMEQALRTNEERDKIEKEAGFLPASAGDIMLRLRTVQMAIDAGMMTDDPHCIAEAGAMLALITEYYPWRGRA